MTNQYDLIILGTGAAGLTAAIYASRYNLNILVIGKDGGMITETSKVCNYPGFPDIDGSGLIDKFTEHAEKSGVKIVYDEVTNIEKSKSGFTIKTTNHNYNAKSIIYGFGGSKRKLGIEDESKFMGKGVTYCATCDAAFYKKKKVMVTGGANSAVSTVILLSTIADQVYLVYRRNQLKAVPALIDQITKKSNVKIMYEHNIKRIQGQKFVESVIIEDTKGKQSEIKVDGIFVEFGCEPNSELAEKVGVELTAEGRIKVNSDMSTNLPGFFAAGDVTNGSNQFDQLITAGAEGSIAAASVSKYLRHQRV